MTPCNGACAQGYVCEAIDGAVGTFCVPELLTCEDRCSGVRCDAGQRCDPFTGGCVVEGCQLNSDCPPTQYCGRSDGFCHATGGGVGVGGTQCVNQGECSAGFVCAGSFFPMCSAICDVNADCGNMITCTQSLTDANILFCSLLPF